MCSVVGLLCKEEMYNVHSRNQWADQIIILLCTYEHREHVFMTINSGFLHRSHDRCTLCACARLGTCRYICGVCTIYIENMIVHVVVIIKGALPNYFGKN